MYKSRPFEMKRRLSFSYKDVFTYKQYGQYPHGDGDGLEFAGHSMTDHIGNDTDEDAVTDAIGQRHDEKFWGRFSVIRKPDSYPLIAIIITFSPWAFAK